MVLPSGKIIPTQPWLWRKMFFGWYHHLHLWQLSVFLLGAICLASCGKPASPAVNMTAATIPATVIAEASATASQQNPPPGLDTVIPRPVSAVPTGGTFRLSADTGIYVEPATDEVKAIGQYLADHLNPASGYAIQVQATNEAPASGNIYLSLTGADPALGNEGYQLTGRSLLRRPDHPAVAAPCH